MAEGSTTLLELRYVRAVERPHGLPTSTKQGRRVSRRGVEYQDVDYRGLVGVELDGRLGHSSWDDAMRDGARDRDVALTGGVTLRYGWADLTDPCRVAAEVGSLLATRGWTGTVRPCGRACRCLGVAA